MRGNPGVVDFLNKAVRHELTAINQYWLHYRLLDNWGYKSLAKQWRKESIEEMEHADKLIERIIFLDGIPSVDVGLKPQLGSKVPEQMEINLKDELDAVRQYNEAVRICTEAGDEGSKALFEGMIRDEERHADFLEAQLHGIKELGIANYLAQQLRDEK